MRNRRPRRSAVRLVIIVHVATSGLQGVAGLWTNPILSSGAREGLRGAGGVFGRKQVACDSSCSRPPWRPSYSEDPRSRRLTHWPTTATQVTGQGCGCGVCLAETL